MPRDEAGLDLELPSPVLQHLDSLGNTLGREICNVNLNTPEDNPLEGTNGWREKGEHRGKRGAVISPVLAILGAEREQKSRSPFPRAEGIWNYKKFSFYPVSTSETPRGNNLRKES